VTTVKVTANAAQLSTGTSIVDTTVGSRFRTFWQDAIANALWLSTLRRALILRAAGPRCMNRSNGHNDAIIGGTSVIVPENGAIWREGA
jgi:hypothetical protein